jgi:hypothetical protein
VYLSSDDMLSVPSQRQAAGEIEPIPERAEHKAPLVPHVNVTEESCSSLANLYAAANAYLPRIADEPFFPDVAAPAIASKKDEVSSSLHNLERAVNANYWPRLVQQDPSGAASVASVVSKKKKEKREEESSVANLDKLVRGSWNSKIDREKLITGPTVLTGKRIITPPTWKAPMRTPLIVVTPAPEGDPRYPKDPSVMTWDEKSNQFVYVPVEAALLHPFWNSEYSLVLQVEEAKEVEEFRGIELAATDEANEDIGLVEISLPESSSFSIDDFRKLRRTIARSESFSQLLMATAIPSSTSLSNIVGVLDPFAAVPVDVFEFRKLERAESQVTRRIVEAEMPKPAQRKLRKVSGSVKRASGVERREITGKGISKIPSLRKAPTVVVARVQVPGERKLRRVSGSVRRVSKEERTQITAKGLSKVPSLKKKGPAVKKVEGAKPVARTTKVKAPVTKKVEVVKTGTMERVRGIVRKITRWM